MWTDCLRLDDAAETAVRARVGYGPRCDELGKCRRHVVHARPRGSIVLVAKQSVPNLASQMRVAFASMALNTGSSSPGELADDLQHFGGRGLLLAIADLAAQLVEQPRVLDGDDGLGGEVLHQLDLLVGERTHLLAIDDDGADQLVLLEHRHGEHGASAAELDGCDDDRIAFEIGLRRP